MWCDRLAAAIEFAFAFVCVCVCVCARAHAECLHLHVFMCICVYALGVCVVFVYIVMFSGGGRGGRGVGLYWRKEAGCHTSFQKSVCMRMHNCSPTNLCVVFCCFLFVYMYVWYFVVLSTSCLLALYPGPSHLAKMGLGTRLAVCLPIDCLYLALVVGVSTGRKPGWSSWRWRTRSATKPDSNESSHYY